MTNITLAACISICATDTSSAIGERLAMTGGTDGAFLFSLAKSIAIDTVNTTGARHKCRLVDFL